MKKGNYLSLLLIGLFLATQCYASGDNAIKTQVWQLQSSFDAFKKQAGDFPAQIKQVQDEMSKLNETIQSQFQTVKSQSDETLKAVQTDIQSQLEKLNASINEINKRLAAKGI